MNQAEKELHLERQRAKLRGAVVREIEIQVNGEEVRALSITLEKDGNKFTVKAKEELVITQIYWGE